MRLAIRLVYSVERIYSTDSCKWVFEKDEATKAYEAEVERENHERIERYKRLLHFDPDEVL